MDFHSNNSAQEKESEFLVMDVSRNDDFDNHYNFYANSKEILAFSIFFFRVKLDHLDEYCFL